MPLILIDLKACNGCGVCVYVCPTMVLELRDGKARAANLEVCLGVRAKQLCAECIKTKEVCEGCVACVKNCPNAAISLV